MKREVQGILLLLMGLAFGRLTLGGQYVYYVKPVMKPFLLVSVAVVLALAAWLLWTAWKERETRPEHDDDHDHGHDHGHMPNSAWLLLLPVLAIYFVAPRPLGAYTAARQIGETPVAVSASGVAPLPAGNPVDLSVSDYVTRAVWDNGSTLQDRSVRLTGFATPNPDGGWWVTRMSLACCAADAFSYRVQVLDSPSPAADAWVEVVGEYAADPTATETGIPAIRAEQVSPVAQPENPYE